MDDIYFRRLITYYTHILPVEVEIFFVNKLTSHTTEFIISFRLTKVWCICHMYILNIYDKYKIINTRDVFVYIQTPRVSDDGFKNVVCRITEIEFLVYAARIPGFSGEKRTKNLFLMEPFHIGLDYLGLQHIYLCLV